MVACSPELAKRLRASGGKDREEGEIPRFLMWTFWRRRCCAPCTTTIRCAEKLLKHGSAERLYLPGVQRLDAGLGGDLILVRSRCGRTHAGADRRCRSGLTPSGLRHNPIYPHDPTVPDRDRLNGWAAGGNVHGGRCSARDFNFVMPQTDLTTPRNSPASHPRASYGRKLSHAGRRRSVCAGSPGGTSVRRQAQPRPRARGAFEVAEQALTERWPCALGGWSSAAGSQVKPRLCSPS